jgi:hypothetical protein
MKDRGLHVPAQSCRHHSTPSRRVDDLPASQQDSKGLAYQDTTCGSIKNQYTRQQYLALSLSLELILALKAAMSCSLSLELTIALTLLKLVLNLRI